MHVPFLHFITCLIALLLGVDISNAMPHPHSGMAVFITSGITTPWPSPSWDSFWDVLANEQEKGLKWATSTLRDAKEAFEDISDKFDDFSTNLKRVVDRSQEMRLELESKIDLHVVADLLVVETSTIIEVLNKEFEKPLPKEMNERARYRADMTKSALNQLEGVFVKISVDLGLPEEEAQHRFTPIKDAVGDVLLVAGNIVDKHPELVGTIVITAASLMIPEALIVRPIFSLFGFGPTGPMKGSLAAFLQRRFWGGAVEKGSWFAFFQRAGMVEGFRAKLAAIFKAFGKLLGIL